MKKQVSNFFKYRSYTPLPFLILMLYFQQASPVSLVVGFMIALAGELFRFWGVAYAGSETRTTGAVGGTYLVVSGAFAHLRNPLYLGNMLLYLGFGIMSMALFPYLQITALIFFYIQYRVIISEEEEYLQRTFGEEFERYRAFVPRFLPKYKGYANANVEQPPLNIKAGIISEKRTLQAFGTITVLLLIIYLLNN